MDQVRWTKAKISSDLNTEYDFAGGPLNEGTFVGGKGCEIQCPWHASRFCVKDGSVHGGPATFDELTWSVRTAASGKLEVRLKR